MNKLIYPLLACFALIFTACGDSDKDEPINSVFAFSSPDNNISITNNGTNAVVNVDAGYNEIIISLLGTFINTEIECPSKWVKATVEDKKLTLKIETNYGDENRSANIAIKANDQAEIVMANMAINQAAPTIEDYDKWQKEDILFVAEYGGGAKDIPSDGELEKFVWYRLYSDNSVIFRLERREDNADLIKVGDVVYPNFVMCYIEQMYYENDWWTNYFFDNRSECTPYTVVGNPSQSSLNEYGRGILDILTKVKVYYGDDFDIVQTSQNGIAKYADSYTAYVYVLQYYKTLNNKAKGVALLRRAFVNQAQGLDCPASIANANKKPTL